MDMQYRILWFDDQRGNLVGQEKMIEANLNTIGFTPKIIWVESFDNDSIKKIIKQLKEHNPYDLILVDYDLGRGSGGELILKRIRNVSSGDMVFYSSTPVPALRNELLKQGVDGVFCLDRTRLGSDVFSIIQNTLRRIIHPNYIRGLVVGSVAEIDALFSEIILALLSLSGMPAENEIKAQLKEKAETFLSEEKGKLEVFERKPLNRIIEKDTNLRTKVDLLIQLLQQENSRTAQNYCDILEKFLNEINDHRINFAHDRTEENDDGIPVFKDRCGRNWTPERMKQLLLKIRDHKLATRNAHQYFAKNS